MQSRDARRRYRYDFGKAPEAALLHRRQIKKAGLLQNRLYRGEIDHKGAIHPGEHEAIVDQDLWDRVQVVLAENRVERAVRSDAASPSLLAGLVRDEDGIPLTPTHANKNGCRYR